MMIYIWFVPLSLRQHLLLLGNQRVKEDLRAYFCRRYCFQTKFVVRFLSNRVVNTAHDFFYLKYFFYDLACHDITVITIGDGCKRVGFLDPGSYQYFFVDAIAHNGGPTKIRVQALERVAAIVNYSYCMSCTI